MGINIKTGMKEVVEEVKVKRNCRNRDTVETHMGSDPGCTIFVDNEGSIFHAVKH